MNMNVVTLLLKLIDTALALGAFAAEDRARLERNANMLRRIAGENRDPTQAEWDQVNTETDGLLEVLEKRLAEAKAKNG